MKKIIIMMIAVVALFVIACGKKTKDVDDKVYYIGLSADFAPFEYREGEKIVGFDPELA
jgi:polar amino acid transport system substrate-binding protein